MAPVFSGSGTDERKRAYSLLIKAPFGITDVHGDIPSVLKVTCSRRLHISHCAGQVYIQIRDMGPTCPQASLVIGAINAKENTYLYHNTMADRKNTALLQQPIWLKGYILYNVHLQ